MKRISASPKSARLWRAGCLRQAVVFCCVLSAFCAAANVSAQVAPALPLSGSSPSSAMQANDTDFVGGASFAHFKELLIPELVPLIKAGKLEFHAAPALEPEWRYDDEWVRNSLQAGESAKAGGIQAGPEQLARRGFVYGVSRQLPVDDNPDEAARRVLWNVSSVFWSEPLIDARFELSELSSNRLSAHLSVLWRRVYLAALSPSDKSTQLFRESLRILSPAPLASYSLLSFRFFGADDEDVFWAYSPAISKTRQLTGSNRMDDLFRTQFSLDDLLLWSGKPENSDVRFDKSVQALTPFATAADVAAAGTEDGCIGIKLPVQDRALVGNASGSSTPASGLVPGSAIFVPRELWRLELVSKDPYSAYGRQILYVDPILMLPVYKIIYDKSGTLQKILLSGFGLANSGERKVPYQAFMLIFAPQEEAATRLDFTQINYCKQFTNDVKLTDFDPVRLGTEQN